MTGRGSVWASEKIRTLAAKFTPATDEVWRLQRGTDPECRYFQNFAHEGHYGAGGGTKQGIYICSPGGELLASINSLNADQVYAVMEQGLERWGVLPLEKRVAPDGGTFSASHRWEDSYPKDGLVLRSIVRDLPLDQVPPAEGAERTGRARRYNLDHAWFSKDEARRLLPEKPVAGRGYKIPDDLVARLARFHVVDNVHGQTLPFAPEEVAGSAMSGIVTKISGPHVSIELRGAIRGWNDGEWRMARSDWTPKREWPRTIEGELLGHATYDMVQGKFVAFDLVALSRWTGTSGLNGRGADDSGYVGHAFELAPYTPSETIAPAYIDVYDVPWVIEPKREEAK